MQPGLTAPPLALMADSMPLRGITSLAHRAGPTVKKSPLFPGALYERMRQETGRRMLLTWESVSTSPPPNLVRPMASGTSQKVSWQPLWQLVYGTTSRTGLTVGAHMLAKHLAALPQGATPMELIRSEIGPPKMADYQATSAVVLLGMLVGLSFVISTISAFAFAADTAKVCRQRAKASLSLSLAGLTSVALGTALGAYYHENQLKDLAWVSILPKIVGFYMLVIRLPHSFTCSELVHGNTPIRARAELSTHLWPIAVCLMVLWSETFSDPRIPPWTGHILFGASLSLLVVAFALTRTDLSRLASKPPLPATPSLATMA